MPELPEVETLRIQLTPLLVGLTIADVKVFKQKSFVGDKNLIKGAKITSIGREGKLIIIDLSNKLSLAIHLKLTGQLIYRGERIKKKLKIIDPLLASLPNKHTRVIIEFANGDKLFFNDLRIFGWMRVVRNETMRQCSNVTKNISSIDNLTGDLGPEPLKDLTTENFKRILHSSKKPVKLVLMDQEKIAGVGNIYANDALFLAKLNPKHPANKLSEGQMLILYNKLLMVLKNGIKWGGASEDNFRNAYGEMGKVQEHFLVYGKKGENCPNNCGGKIQRIALGGRGTYFCPKCQK